MHFDVIPIPAFQDNYIWALCDGRQAAVVDPGEAPPVREFLARRGLRLCAVLLTHHHMDHVGGLAGLVGDNAIPVYGPRDKRIEGITRHVGNGDAVHLPEFDVRFEVIAVPGHTLTHIAYYGASSLFCGDTLFACGCGRLFEGTPAQMIASLAKLAALPDDTRVYCGHEYTLANIRFARTVEPDNQALAAREANTRETRAQGQPTLPSTIGREKATNPFLRWQAPEVIAAAGRYAGTHVGAPEQVFAAIRQWKNEFPG